MWTWAMAHPWLFTLLGLVAMSTSCTAVCAVFGKNPVKVDIL